MRTAEEAVQYSHRNGYIPYPFVNNLGVATRVGGNECARSVLNDYGLIPVTTASIGTATDLWLVTANQFKNYGTRSIPRGGLAVFPNYAKSGHVAIATGGRNGTELLTTPVSQNPRVDGNGPKYLTTIDELERQCGNPYVGYLTGIVNTPFDLTTTAETGRPIPEKEEESMSQNVTVFRRPDESGPSYIVSAHGISAITNSEQAAGVLGGRGIVPVNLNDQQIIGLLRSYGLDALTRVRRADGSIVDSLQSLDTLPRGATIARADAKIPNVVTKK